MLIERKAGEFDPSEFHNRYVDALKDLIAEKQKKKGEKVIQDPDADKGPPKGSNVIDLMAALKKSLGDDKRKKDGLDEPKAKKAAAEEALDRQEGSPKSRRARGRKSWRSAPASTSRPTTEKRDFTKTKEPKGRKLKGKGDSFVVQKHDASHLHWDFRLELDGVLKSWAVPKGPSLDPDEKRLAMRTEDHPLDYGNFEGTIPAGEYGGGTVMLWDQGRWIPHPDKDPRKTIEEGHLHFTLEGERMKGEWVMFRLKPRPGEKRETWMLKKVTDEFANAENGDELVDECVTSVTTGRTMAEIASGSDVWRSNRGGQKGGRGEEEVERGSSAVPSAAARDPRRRRARPARNWLFEYKYDGYRLLIATGGGAATAWTRNGKDWSDKFRALVKAAAQPPARLPDRRRGGRARRRGQAGLPAAPVDAQGKPGQEPRLLRLRPARRSRRGHHAPAEHRAQGPAEVAPRRSSAADPVRRSRDRSRRGSLPRDLQAGRRRRDREGRRRALPRRTQPATGSRSNASSARNS